MAHGGNDGDGAEAGNVAVLQAAPGYPWEHWDQQALGDGNFYVELNPNTHHAEYERVVHKYNAAADNDETFHIKKVYRIQNPELFIQYHEQKKKIIRYLADNELDFPLERDLWHGTDKEAARLIVKHEFNRTFSGFRYGHFCGEGSYFYSSSSIAITHGETIGDCHIFLAKVVTGKLVQGAEDTNRQKLGPYVSSVDDMNDPKTFVVYHDAAAYPEYLIITAYRIDD